MRPGFWVEMKMDRKREEIIYEKTSALSNLVDNNASSCI